MACEPGHVGCVDAATKVLGDKWTPMLLRSMYNDGQLGFCQLQDSAGGINPRTLSARLSRLEEQGIIERCGSDAAEPGTRRDQYRLSEKGTALIPILASMAQWSSRFGAVGTV